METDVKWIPYTSSMDKTNFIYAAIDLDGTDLCIGRAHHNGEIIPGKIRMKQNELNFCYNGKEVAFSAAYEFGCRVERNRSAALEVLIKEPDDEYEWIKSEDGKIPPNAVVGGKSKDGEYYYVGRAKHLEVTVPGHIVPSKKCIFIPFGWNQYEKNEYEVLVKKAKSYSEPQPIFSIQNPIFDSQPPPAFDSQDVPYGWAPPPPSYDTLDINSPFLDTTKKSVEWIHWSPEESWPHNAIPAGICNEGDLNKSQFIARSRHNGNMILGYAYMNGPFYSVYQGQEISRGDFELLIENSEIFPKETL